MHEKPYFEPEYAVGHGLSPVELRLQGSSSYGGNTFWGAFPSLPRDSPANWFGTPIRDWLLLKDIPRFHYGFRARNIEMEYHQEDRPRQVAERKRRSGKKSNDGFNASCRDSERMNKP